MVAVVEVVVLLVDKVDVEQGRVDLFKHQLFPVIFLPTAYLICLILK